MAYDWVKALHIISVIAWMAGLLYLPRLYVYHAMVEAGSVRAETFKLMERRLLKAIMNPAMIASWGFGLAIANDLMSGTSSPCVTFGSPSLSNQHSDGSVFEIVNLELWTLTPCMAIADAEKLQLGKLFLQRD